MKTPQAIRRHVLPLGVAAVATTLYASLIAMSPLEVPEGAFVVAASVLFAVYLLYTAYLKNALFAINASALLLAVILLTMETRTASITVVLPYGEDIMQASLQYVGVFAVILFGGAIYFENLTPQTKRQSLDPKKASNEETMQVVFMREQRKVRLQFSKKLAKRHRLKKRSMLISYEQFKKMVHPSDLPKAWFAKKDEETALKTAHFKFKLPGSRGYTTMFRYGLYPLSKGTAYTAYDVTSVQLISTQLAAREQQYKVLENESKKVMEMSQDLIVKLDKDGTVLHASEKALEVYGRKREDVIGKNALKINESVGRTDHGWLDEVLEKHSATGTAQILVNDRKKYIRWNYEAINDDEGNVDYIMAIGHDVTYLYETEKRFANDKNHDHLTGLLNQQGLYETIAATDNIEKAVSFFIDIRGFSQINDYYGHAVGDEILVSIANKLRVFEHGQCFVSRFSGDEFVLYCVNEEAERDVIERYIDTLKTKAVSIHRTEDLNIEVKTNIGYACYPEDTNDKTSLISLSSLAMKEGALQNGTPVARYRKKMSDTLRQNILVANKLQRAIEDEAIEIHFQEVKNVKDDSVDYLEQLARWSDSKLGNVPPDEFIDIADKSNLLDKLERYIVEKTLRLFKVLRKQKPYRSTKVSVNLSPTSLLDERFLTFFNQTLKKYGIEASDVCVEISENTFVNNLDLCVRRIGQYKKHEYQIALDDFGKEYSSLAILENVDFDIIKIDAVFTRKIHSVKNQEIVKMVRKITRLSHKELIAEGVETSLQKEILQELDCDLQQGYLFHKPQKLT